MTTNEVQVPGTVASISSQNPLQHAAPVVLRNSRFLCWLTRIGGIVSGLMSLCALIIFLSNLKGAGFVNEFWWLVATISFALGAARLWQLGRDMLQYEVQLDERGVDLNLGTKKSPAKVFFPWDQITAVKRRRAGNVQQFWVLGKNGGEAGFSSYTFFRPKKVARMIAERAGLTIEKI